MTDKSATDPRMPADLPVIIEQLQNQLDDLTAVLHRHQELISEQATRISALEQS